MVHQVDAVDGELRRLGVELRISRNEVQRLRRQLDERVHLHTQRVFSFLMLIRRLKPELFALAQERSRDGMVTPQGLHEAADELGVPG